jgi:hypothetical protein
LIVSSLVAAGIVAVPVAALASRGWSVNRLLNTCIGQEGDQFPELEHVAEKTLSGMALRTSRYSGCEDTGEPGPALQAVLLDWHLRERAATHLARNGWTQEGGPLSAFTSADGEYVARIILATDYGETHPLVHFEYAE